MGAAFDENIGVAMLMASFTMLNLPPFLVFAKAAFSVPKLNDIWSLEKMTSKELCWVPNLLFTIVFLTFSFFFGAPAPRENGLR